MGRSNLFRGIDRHTFVVVIQGRGRDGGYVLHHRPASSVASSSLRVVSREEVEDLHRWSVVYPHL